MISLLMILPKSGPVSLLNTQSATMQRRVVDFVLLFEELARTNPAGYLSPMGAHARKRTPTEAGRRLEHVGPISWFSKRLRFLAVIFTTIEWHFQEFKVPSRDGRHRRFSFTEAIEEMEQYGNRTFAFFRLGVDGEQDFGFKKSISRPARNSKPRQRKGKRPSYSRALPVKGVGLPAR